MEQTPRQLDLRFLLSKAMKKRIPVILGPTLWSLFFLSTGVKDTPDSRSSQVSWGSRCGRGGKQVASHHCTDGAVGGVFALSLTRTA